MWKYYFISRTEIISLKWVKCKILAYLIIVLQMYNNIEYNRLNPIEKKPFDKRNKMSKQIM